MKTMVLQVRSGRRMDLEKEWGKRNDIELVGSGFWHKIVPNHLLGSQISAHPPNNHNSVLLLFPFNMFLNFICLFPNSPNSVPLPFKSKFQWLRCSSSPSCLFPSRRRGLRWGWEGRRSRTRPCRSATRSGLPWRMWGQCYIINKLVNQN